MAHIQHVLKADLDLSNPVPEICAVIQAVAAAQRQHEEAILLGVMEAVERRLQQLKGDESIAEPVRKPDSKQENK
ncbi:hypothetical protein [Paenibacillus pinihumi]|uniref:hypothetical protein n=1 Tax=Paenibacillus pinihumi TaxID=669462 RepID=UPI00041ECCD8|nr:hypothetical protein [Paenibacillus pinihumi]